MVVAARVSHQRAFSVIELLLVVSVITILVAVLLPVFFTAREMARKSTCLSNLRQLGHAFRMYAQDWDETYPLNRFGSVSSGYPGFYTWRSAIAPHVSNKEVTRCPSNSYANSPLESGEPGFRSYALNAAAGELGPIDAAITEPSETILLTEARYGFPDVYPSDQPWCSFRFSFDNEAAPDADLGVLQTHTRKTNFLFFGGNCQSIRPSETLRRHLPLTLWHYSLAEPINYGSQSRFEVMRQIWSAQLAAHKEYR